MVLTELMYRMALACLLIAAPSVVRADSVRYLRWPEVQALVAALTAMGEKLPPFADDKEWDYWIRAHDPAVRDRADRGIEDTVSAWILSGTSFGPLPRIASAAQAVNTAGGLTANARSRVDAFIQALDDQDTERSRMVVDSLRRWRVPQDELAAFLTGNLRRYALEQTNRKAAAGTDGPLALDTAFVGNVAIEDALRALKSKPGVPAHIRRVAVIGPGMDFTGEADFGDSGPVQSIQPFAIIDSLLRLGWAQASDVQMAAFDLNPWVIAHLRSAKARAGTRYVLQIPHRTSAGWNAAWVSYWQHFGENIGTPAAAIAAPAGYEIRAIAVKPQFLSHMRVDEMNVVAQTFDAPQGFDLVVATNILDSYGRLDQTLALANMTQMLAPGGVLVADGGAAAVKPADLESLGGVMYRRR